MGGCDLGHLFWMLIVIGALNALSDGLDWLAKVIPGERDDKIFAAIKKALAAVQNVIDLFTTRGRRK